MSDLLDELKHVRDQLRRVTAERDALVAEHAARLSSEADHTRALGQLLGDSERGRRVAERSLASIMLILDDERAQRERDRATMIEEAAT